MRVRMELRERTVRMNKTHGLKGSTMRIDQ